MKEFIVTTVASVERQYLVKAKTLGAVAHMSMDDLRECDLVDINEEGEELQRVDPAPPRAGRGLAWRGKKRSRG